MNIRLITLVLIIASVYPLSIPASSLPQPDCVGIPGWSIRSVIPMTGSVSGASILSQDSVNVSPVLPDPKNLHAEEVKSKTSDNTYYALRDDQHQLSDRFNQGYLTASSEDPIHKRDYEVRITPKIQPPLRGSLRNNVTTAGIIDPSFSISALNTAITTRVSVNSYGEQSNGHSFSPSISADGRFVAFYSSSSNLVPGDTNSMRDVFVHDRQNGTMTRISVNSTGAEGNSDSYYPSISSDGRFVSFQSYASNLISDDSNGCSDTFVHDRQTGITTLASINSTGVQGNYASSFASISSDGRFVAFYSYASNLVPVDTNSYSDIFVHDRQTGNTTLVSVNSTGVQGDNPSFFTSISSDGRFVVFQSYASNLVSDDTNNMRDVFVHDRQTGITTRVSVNSTGVQGNSDSVYSSISSGGRFVTYTSGASNLVTDDSNGLSDIFVYDRQTGITTRVSVNSTGVQGNSGSEYSSISSDGRYVGFFSYASNLVSDDSNGCYDVFMHDRQTGTTKRISLSSYGVQGNADSDEDDFLPSLSSDGRFVAYSSGASNLVSDDTNNMWDIFVHDRDASPPPIIAGINPFQSSNTGTQTVNITGTNFKTGAVVVLTNSSIRVPGTVTFRNNSTLLCSFLLTGAPSWVYHLTVTNPDGQSAIIPNAFTVTNATPAITSITPSSGYNSTNLQVTVTGTSFRSGVSVSLVNGSTILPGTVSSRTSSKIICTLPLNGTSPGKYNLSVLNSDGLSATKNNAFTVQQTGTDPTIASFSPISGVNTAALPFTITGANYRAGATVTITNGTTNRTAPGTLTGSTKVTCSLPLSGLPIGVYNLTVKNTDGSFISQQDAVSVTNPAPSITTISPTSGYSPGSTVVTVTGSKFVTGVNLSLVRGGTSIPGSVTSFASTKIVGTFLLTGAAPGTYNLTLTNPGGPNATKPFTILLPGTDPTITGLTPESGINTAVLPITITGTNFRTGATVTITNGTTNKAAPGTLTGSTQLKCPLPLTGLPIGLYNLTVRNTDGSNVTRENAFTVNNPTPTISSVAPSSGYNSGSISVTISGTKFVSGLSVTLTNGSSNIQGTVSSLTATKYIGTFTLPGFPAGLYNVIVTNPGGQNATKTNGFTVLAPSTDPTIANFSPGAGVNTAALPFVVNGTNFRTGATVTITNGTSTKTVSGTLIGSTKIACSLPLTGLPIGQYNVTVRNSDGSSGTSGTNFTVVNPPPVITTVAPSSGYNTSIVSVAISGTKFVSGLQATLVNGSTILSGTVSGFAATKFTCTFPVTGAPAGLYNLTVTNPGGPNATKPNSFTVLSPGTVPTIIDFSPTSGVNTAALPIVVNGTNFRAGATVTITNGTTTKTVTGTQVGSTKLKCSLPLTGLPIGSYDLIMRNTDGSSVTLPGAFFVTNPDPTITTLSPLSGYNTGPIPVTITGTKFVAGATIVLINGSTTVPGAVLSLSATSIAGSFPLTGAPAGKYNLTVSNPGSIKCTKLNAFTLLAPGTAPVISTISPASGFNNANLPVTITGMNFRTTGVFLNQGSVLKPATATTGKTSSTTTLYVTLPLKGVPGGLYNITIRNSDGVNTTATDIFYVTDQAWISSAPEKAGISPLVQEPKVPRAGNPLGNSLAVGHFDRQVPGWERK